MTIKEISAEKLARMFHYYHETLSADSVEGDGKSCSMWADVPTPVRDRIVTALELALIEIEADVSETKEQRRWFAKPGEAEWGC